MDDGAEDEASEGQADVRAAWCRWCGAGLIQPTGAGRPRQYCKQSCRQQAHIARKLADAAGMSAEHVVVPRADYEALLERVSSLRAAVADLDRVAPSTDDAADLRQSLDWLLSFARDV